VGTTAQDPRAGSDAAHPRTPTGDPIVSETLDGMSVQQLDDLIERAKATRAKVTEKAATVSSGSYSYDGKVLRYVSHLGPISKSEMNDCTVREFLYRTWLGAYTDSAIHVARIILASVERAKP
jgi:hypothetical protein